MYIPSSLLPRFVEKRQTESLTHSESSLIPHVDNKFGLIFGSESFFLVTTSLVVPLGLTAVPPVGLAVAAILALLLGGLIKRHCLRRSKPKSGPSPGEVQTAARPPSPLSRPSNTGSDCTESTLCTDPVGVAKELYDCVPRPPSVRAAAPQTLVPPFRSRPPSALSVASIASQYSVNTERSSGWQSIGQRLDEKAGAKESPRTSTASTLHPISPVPTSPRSPTSPSSPIRLPSPVSPKDSKRYLYGSS